MSVEACQWRISEHEFREAVRRTRDAQRLPRGQRSEAKRRIAADYGVCPRTLERWLHYRGVETVVVSGYAALFIVNGRGPAQVTPWEKGA